MPAQKLLRFMLICLTVLSILIGLPGCAAAPTATPIPTPLPTPEVLHLSPTDPGAISLAAECREKVDELAQLKEGLVIPDHLSAGEPFRQDGDFDPNSYFTVFTHLNMAPGYVLDYIYFSDRVGGMPLVYARESDSPSFLSYADFLASYGEEVTDEASYGTLGHSYDYLKLVQVDGTPQSYFEHLTLALFGNLFYLWWHSLYQDTILLCEAGDLQLIEQNLKDSFDIELPEEVKAQAEQLDFTPVIQIGEDSVILRVILFTKWGGFYESIFELDRNDPSVILDTEHTKLIEYDCGVTY